MAFKFKVGRAVRFIDCEKNKYSPPHGTIGTVLKVGAIGVDYLVKFQMGRLLALRICQKVGISGIMKMNWRP